MFFFFAFTYVLKYSCTEHGGSQQTSDASWWPKPFVFEKSGLYVGYWSTVCEAWFQTRLQQIRAGHESVKKGNEWRGGAIKFQKATPILVQANNEAAQKFLHTYSPPL